MSELPRVLGVRDPDVFISHAGEDKAAVARPLARALAERGWYVWLDELELTVGDSLSRRIDQALVRSRFGVVVLSPAFFAKAWPQRELAGLVAREVDAAGEKVILPVWHGVGRHDIAQWSPTLADRLGALTSAGIEDVADKITAALARAADRVDQKTGPGSIVQPVSSVQAETGLSFAVPASPEEQDELVTAKPPLWEYLLYAGVLMQGKARLETRWRDHVMRMPRGERREFDGVSDAIRFIGRQTSWITSQTEARMRIFEPGFQEQAFGAPGEPGDPASIEHFAHHILAMYETYMDWAASLRNASLPDVWSEVQEVSSKMADGPVEGIREYIDTVVAEGSRIPVLLATHREGDPPIEVRLTLVLEIDQSIVDANTEAMERALRLLADEAP